MKEFLRILAGAIQDFAEHGYSDKQRLAGWIFELEEAANNVLPSDVILEKNMADSLRAIYRRATESNVFKAHPGVSRLTLQIIQPQLRQELDRRILAAADLIKINRKQAIEKTLQRFSGWATSIPYGGSKVIDRSEVKETVKKSLSQVNYEVRRLNIDQGHKLISSINQAIAAQTGAIAMEWHSHWRQAGYDARPDHKERDGKVYAIRGSWAVKDGLINKGAGYTDEMTAPAEEIFCLPGDSRIPFADGVEVAYRRWYSGELAVIVTSSGKTLRATPNHPILTTHGWIGIGALNKGDKVVEIADDGINPGAKLEANEDEAEPMIAQIFGAVSKFGVSQSCGGKRKQFHGDGSDSNVDVVRAARPLRFGNERFFDKRVKKFGFSDSADSVSMSCAADFGLIGHSHAAHSIVCGGGESGTSINPFSIHTDAGRVGSIASSDPTLLEHPHDGAASYLHRLGNGENTFAGQKSCDDGVGMNIEGGNGLHPIADDESIAVQLAEKRGRLNRENLGDFLNGLPFGTKFADVVEVKRERFDGHVYNLQTVSGWYVAESIITHNCRCYGTYFISPSQLPEDMLTKKGLDWIMQKNKERSLRAA